MQFEKIIIVLIILICAIYAYQYYNKNLEASKINSIEIPLKSDKHVRFSENNEYKSDSFLYTTEFEPEERPIMYDIL